MDKAFMLLAIVPFMASLALYVRKNPSAVWVLVLGAFIIRIAVSMMDPFLHDWDEKFHALVAKNMMTYPFQPMLRVHPILEYDYTAWCCNHIWLHKQPLFMWQMALSMKVFGINEVAIRIPSALLSAAMVWWIYRIALIWTGQFNTAYTAAWLSAFSWFQIELVSGAMGLDHNDMVFTAYITGSIWAFCEYSRNLSRRWAIITGVLVGCAILVKWLTALLVFGGWGLWLLWQKEQRLRRKNWIDIVLAAGVATVIALPWQLYIMSTFPRESAYEYGYNVQHITEKLGAYTDVDWTFHFSQWGLQYGNLLLPFLVLGLMTFLPKKRMKSTLTIPMLAMAVVVYGFFSFMVQTKMPAFVYMICAVPLILSSIGVNRIFQMLDMLSLNQRRLHVPVLLFFSLYLLRPVTIFSSRDPHDPERQAKIDNTRIFKNFNRLPEDYLVFNCKSYEDIDMRFYTPYNAHSWCPSAADLDSLLAAGYKIAIFQAHRRKKLPDYVVGHPGVLFIPEQFK